MFILLPLFIIEANNARLKSRQSRKDWYLHILRLREVLSLPGTKTFYLDFSDSLLEGIYFGIFPLK